MSQVPPVKERFQAAAPDKDGTPTFKWSLTDAALKDPVLLVTGPFDVLPIIFIPGASSDETAWDPQREYFSKKANVMVIGLTQFDIKRVIYLTGGCGLWFRPPYQHLATDWTPRAREP